MLDNNEMIVLKAVAIIAAQFVAALAMLAKAWHRTQDAEAQRDRAQGQVIAALKQEAVAQGKLELAESELAEIRGAACYDKSTIKQLSKELEDLKQRLAAEIQAHSVASRDAAWGRIGNTAYISPKYLWPTFNWPLGQVAETTCVNCGQPIGNAGHTCLYYHPFAGRLGGWAISSGDTSGSNNLNLPIQVPPKESF